MTDLPTLPDRVAGTVLAQSCGVHVIERKIVCHSPGCSSGRAVRRLQTFGRNFYTFTHIVDGRAYKKNSASRLVATKVHWHVLFVLSTGLIPNCSTRMKVLRI